MVAAGSGSLGDLQVCDASSGLVVAHVSREKMMAAAAISPDGRWVAFSEANEVRIAPVDALAAH